MPGLLSQLIKCRWRWESEPAQSDGSNDLEQAKMRRSTAPERVGF